MLPAEKLAQTRPGAVGALLFQASIPLAEFGGVWPPRVALQMHVMEDDELGNVEVARELETTVEGGELFLYPGSGHLFADSSLADYVPPAANLLIERVLAFLR